MKHAHTENEQSNTRPFYFLVTFWGEAFREYFITLLLASLLAPNNIPALRNKKVSKFIIATTDNDWQALQSDVLFKTLLTHINVEFVDLGDPDLTKQKMKLMSHGHKLVSELAFRDKAIGVFLTPDLILSDGSITVLQNLVTLGKKVVLCPAVRYEYYGCMEGFERLGVMRPGKPMVLSARQIMSVVLRNFHSETVTWLWDEPFYAPNPVVSLWKALGEANYILHGYSWAPLAVDYGALQNHDIKTFELSTLDQDYIYRNFGVSDDIYVVTDSDEITLVSFTKEEEMHVPLHAEPAQNISFLRKVIKKNNLRRFHYCPVHGMDPLKKQLVLKTIYLHSDDITSEWEEVVRRSQRLIKASIKKPPLVNMPFYVIYNRCSILYETYKLICYRTCEVYRVNCEAYKAKPEPLIKKIIFLPFRVLKHKKKIQDAGYGGDKKKVLKKHLNKMNFSIVCLSLLFTTVCIMKDFFKLLRFLSGKRRLIENKVSKESKRGGFDA